MHKFTRLPHQQINAFSIQLAINKRLFGTRGLIHGITTSKRHQNLHALSLTQKKKDRFWLQLDADNGVHQEPLMVFL